MLILALLNIGSKTYMVLGTITSQAVITFYVSCIIMLGVFISDYTVRTPRKTHFLDALYISALLPVYYSIGQ